MALGTLEHLKDASKLSRSESGSHFCFEKICYGVAVIFASQKYVAKQQLMAEVEQFIPYYPSIASTHNFTREISKQKEFYDLKMEPTEEVPEHPGELLMAQKLMQRYLSPHTDYQSGIIGHGPGTGKTCIMAGIRENFKLSLIAGKPRKPALVITKSEVLGANTLNEIAKVCTRDVYKPSATKAELKKGKDMSAAAAKLRLARSVAKTYEIVSFEQFLTNLPDDELIIKRYSDRVILIDEAHTLRIQPKKAKGKGKAKGKAVDEDEGDEDIENIDGEDAGDDEKGISSGLYEKLHHFLHIIERCRVVLLTGTVIWDQTNEIASLANLILPLDEQLPTGREFDKTFFDDEGNLTSDAKAMLKERLKGKVSMLRQMITTARRIEMGVKLPWTKHTIVYPDVMSENQSARVSEIYVDKKKDSVLRAAREAANMVVPIFDSKGAIKDFGNKKTFDKISTHTQMRRDPKTGNMVPVHTFRIADPVYLGYIKNHLREISIKFASIIHELKTNRKEVAFIYIENVTGPGGALSLALTLQQNGFIWAKSASGIKTVQETPRFTVITAHSQTINTPAGITELLDSSNKLDNKYADRIQVIIGSQKIATGVSIKRVRQMHIVMPPWNMPSGDQALYRAIRFGGHEGLEPEERYVKIYRHCAVDPGTDGVIEKGKGFPVGAGWSKRETIDTHVYNIAEDKEYRNTQVYRLLKEVAFDCALAYRRNVLETDTEGSRECDYKKCNYQCSGFPLSKDAKTTKVWDYSIPEEELDRTNYDLFYAEERIKEIQAHIVVIFRSYFSMSLHRLRELLVLPDDENMLLLTAIDRVINSRTIIRNRYGFRCYLKEKGNIVFLDASASHSSNYTEASYISNPLVSDISSMSSLVEVIELENNRRLLEEFCKTPSKALLDRISHNAKILIIEAAHQLKDTTTLNAAQRKTVDIAFQELGRNLFTAPDKNVIHIMYSTEFKGVAYDVGAKEIVPTGKTRIYDQTTKTWRFPLTVEEEKAYLEEGRDHRESVHRVRVWRVRSRCGRGRRKVPSLVRRESHPERNHQRTGL